MLSIEANGVGPGSELRQLGNDAVRLRAKVRSIFPVDRLEIVANGEVVAQRKLDAPAGEIDLQLDLELTEDSWVTARCFGPGADVARHHDVWRRPVMAHSSPIYLAQGENYQRFDPEVADYMLALIEARGSTSRSAPGASGLAPSIIAMAVPIISPFSWRPSTKPSKPSVTASVRSHADGCRTRNN